MNERYKYKEAEYFLSEMPKYLGKEAFRYYLSAFLAASRSVLQYSYEEGKKKSGWEKWYGEKMKSPYFKFFKDKRDFNIHRGPIQQNIIVIVNEGISVKENIIKSDKTKEKDVRNDFVKNDSRSGRDIGGMKSTSFIYYKLDGWHGKEDVLTLCNNYLKQLKDYIEEGIDRGFFSGRE